MSRHLSITRVGMLLMLISAVYGVGAVWWWALLGMTVPVGVAVVTTASLVGLVGLGCILSEV